MPPDLPPPKIIISTGEPAGIGPDVVLQAATKAWPAHLIAVGDRNLLATRAATLGISINLVAYTATDVATAHVAGELPLIDIPLQADCRAGVLNPANASYVLAQLDLTMALCQAGETAAMVTAPVQKSVINDAGIPFLGHTEYLAAATNTPHVVMMLASGDLRVALTTTHLPLADVPSAITREHLEQTLTVLHTDLVNRFGISQPTLAVLGLNPHAGEGGHLGKEEIDTIAPVCEALRENGFLIEGPLPADSAFIPSVRDKTDAYLAMYHDQGLPVLKALGFQGAVNITLGLPFTRTSVDHGTALSLAGTGNADAGSLEAAIGMAIELSA
ncbi:MAG: 4-hydroxythreonine-4-phosphate dehydrogenase PdxA [Halieaceae bacterium]|nr:4-hydroxythreonine-4-phosphate dehydrogenase PdxA [Halieaceae bacterium]